MKNQDNTVNEGLSIKQSDNKNEKKLSRFFVGINPFIRNTNIFTSSIPRIMWTVIISLVPVLIASIFHFGINALLLILVSVISCVGVEAFSLWIFKKDIRQIKDGSAVLTGLLLSMIISPGVPLYLPVIGSIIAIFVTKQLFGGLGFNIFNPALIARAFLLASFPVAMTVTWYAPLETGDSEFIVQFPKEAKVNEILAGDQAYYSFKSLEGGNEKYNIVKIKLNKNEKAEIKGAKLVISPSFELDKDYELTINKSITGTNEDLIKHVRRDVVSKATPLNILNEASSYEKGYIEMLLKQYPYLSSDSEKVKRYLENLEDGNYVSIKELNEIINDDNIKEQKYNLYLDMFLGIRAGSMGETAIFLLLLGGIFLILTGIVTWHIPVSTILTVGLLSWIFGGTEYFTGDPVFAVLSGGLILGAIYMASDYVTSPIYAPGKIIFGIGIGALTVLIRIKGGYPEGVCYAILLMNIVSPLLDSLFKPKKFGEIKATQKLSTGKTI